MIIEFIGLPGSGKSTLLETTKATWSEIGLIVMTIPKAGPHCLKRMLLGCLICWLVPTKHQDWVLYGVFRRFIQLYRLKFALKKPRFTWHVISLILRRPIPWSNKRSVLGWFFRDVSYYEFFPGRLQPQEVLILDEGLVQRATSLYALPFEKPDPAQIRQYIKSLPRADVVIWVQTSLDISVERVLLRGKLKRYWGEELKPFIKNSGQVIEIALQTMGSLGWNVIRVSNDETPAKGSAHLGQILREQVNRAKSVEFNGLGNENNG